MAEKIAITHATLQRKLRINYKLSCSGSQSITMHEVIFSVVLN